jgi:hypothetical protein
MALGETYQVPPTIPAEYDEVRCGAFRKAQQGVALSKARCPQKGTRTVSLGCTWEVTSHRYYLQMDSIDITSIDKYGMGGHLAGMDAITPSDWILPFASGFCPSHPASIGILPWPSGFCQLHPASHQIPASLASDGLSTGLALAALLLARRPASTRAPKPLAARALMYTRVTDDGCAHHAPPQALLKRLADYQPALSRRQLQMGVISRGDTSRLRRVVSKMMKGVCNHAWNEAISYAWTLIGPYVRTLCMAAN